MSVLPFISVIIPVYNVEDYLERCIDSITGQTFKDIEIILVDDGSTDGSGAICDEYANNDKRIRVIHKENGGLVSARKAGIKEAKGRYVSNIDADDWLEAEAYEYVTEIVNKNNVDIVCCSFYKEYGALLEKREEYLDEGIYTKRDILNQFKSAVKDKPFYSPVIHDSLCTKLIRRDFLEVFQLRVDDRIVNGEDDAVVLPLLLEIDSVYVCKKSFYHYCVRKTSVSWKKRKDDLYRLGILSNHLKENFVNRVKHNPGNYIYKYFLYTMAVFWLDMMDLADSGYLDEKNELPFWPDVKRGNDIVVYGKGLWASNLISVIQRASFCNIIANIDSSDLDDYKDFINKDEYDHVIIAIADGRIRSKVKSTLLELGVIDSKICLFDKQNITEDKIPFINHMGNR